MAPSADFLAFLKDQLRGLGHITTRRMFSGAGLYCDGLIFALILRDTLYFKVDDGNRQAYEAEGLEPFTYEARGRKVRIGAYWQVPERLFDDPDEMLDWARGALAAATARAREEKAESQKQARQRVTLTPARRLRACRVAPGVEPTMPASRTAPRHA